MEDVRPMPHTGFENMIVVIGKQAPPYVALNALPVTKDNVLEA